MEIIGKTERAPIHGQHMTTIMEWGPEYEVRFQIKFNKEPVDVPMTKNLFRFTIFNSVYDRDEPGANIPAMWIHGKPHPHNIMLPHNLQIATTINNELKDWNLPVGNFSVGKWYNVTIKQYNDTSPVNMFIFTLGKPSYLNT